jgi:hypothetical protein
MHLRREKASPARSPGRAGGGHAVATRWPPRGTTPACFRHTSGARTYRTPYATPSCPRPGSKTSGDDVAAQLFGVRSQMSFVDGYSLLTHKSRTKDFPPGAEMPGFFCLLRYPLDRSLGQHDDEFGQPSGFCSVLPCKSRCVPSNGAAGVGAFLTRLAGPRGEMDQAGATSRSRSASHAHDALM